MAADSPPDFRLRLRRDGNAVIAWLRDMWTRRWFRWLGYLVLAGLLGYRYWRDHRAPAAAAEPTASTPAAEVPAAPPRMYGRIAFTPCTLAPQFGAARACTG